MHTLMRTPSLPPMGPGGGLTVMLPEPSSRKMRDSGACTGPTAGEGCGEMTWDGAELGVRASDRERFSFRMVSKRPNSSYGVRGYLTPRRGANE